MIYGELFQIVQLSTAVTNTVSQSLTHSIQLSIQSGNSLSLLDFAIKGGPVMIPIALLSLLAVFIFIERYMLIIRATKHDANFMLKIRDFMHNGRLDSAMSLCSNTNTPIAHMIEKGLHRLGRPLADINAAIENVGSLEVAKLEKNISLLGTVAGAAPMLGFLGSVIGMAQSFYDMSETGKNIDIQLLSGGIYQALISTIAGLIVGIIAYFGYNLLVGRVHKLVFVLQLRANEFMDILHEPAK